MMDKKDIHKHFDHIIKSHEKLDPEDIVDYLTLMSEKVKMPFDSIIEEFVFYWKNKI